jgi:hypothetical protein
VKRKAIGEIISFLSPIHFFYLFLGRFWQKQSIFGIEMKKTARRTGVVVMVMALMITFCGVPAASRPACPTPETQSIKTVILISCRGGVTEEMKVNWESSSEDLLNSPPVQNRCRRVKRREYGYMYNIGRHECVCRG